MQRAYEERRRHSEPGFSLLRSTYGDPRKWLTAAKLMNDMNMAPEQVISACFEGGRTPQPWEVLRFMHSREFDAKAKAHRDSGSGTPEQRVESLIRWAMERFLEVVGDDGLNSPTYVSALVTSEISVQPWLRVLLGYRYEDVLRRHLPAALEYFEANPDVAHACLRLGFPPVIINPGRYGG